ncbi:MAG TPA: DUF499 domain-containing protein, partial [Armatimonadota bacterium]|nr:DUF499 domain-containing protein [Armatimonadota bacterium]
GGDDGTPLRKTPWGEIAYQLGGDKGLAVVAEHERQMTAPAGDVIRKFLPKGKPCLILVDELMNYVSRNRKSGLSGQLYDFIHNLSETARSEPGVVLAVSVPASELEMTAEDQSDYERFKKLLDRVGKAILISAESETSEIIRRRLFEWDPRAVSADGRILLPRKATETCAEFADWVVDHRQQLPNWFPIDNARKVFEATYPFHPMLLSVFERKWQTLPRFQQTRGVLRLVALWVSQAYQQGYKGAHRDPLIGLGTAPLEDPMFRAAVFEQLGENRLEAAITTDIIGKQDAHAIRLDNEAVETIKKGRLHRKVATAIFFESNGGMARGEATVPELRLGVGEPELDIGNIETVLETLGSTCYYLNIERNRYRFSIHPNLNKLLADRRANVQAPKIEETVRESVQKAFPGNRGVDVRFFPANSGQIPDRPVLTLAVLPPEQSMQVTNTVQSVDSMIRQCGAKSRTCKSAILWSVADSDTALKENAREWMAWKEIQGEQETLRLDEAQR